MADGLIHVYTGDGKGKTTAAIGLSMRAFASGMRVCVVQFMKISQSGEVDFINSLADENFRVFRFEEPHLFLKKNDGIDSAKLRSEVKCAIDFVCGVLDDKRCDMLVLDEIICAHAFKLATKDELLDIIAKKPSECELVLTGRDAPQWLIDKADYVTEMKLVKHPYEKNIDARKGIEF